MTNIDAYKNFEFEDFINDTQFRNWVLFPSKKQDEFWGLFLRIYPEKQKVIKEARAFMLGTKEYFDQTEIGSQKLNTGLQGVLDRTSLNTLDLDNEKPVLSSTTSEQCSDKHKKPKLFGRLAMAASLVLILGALSWFWFSAMNGKITYTTTYGEWKTIELPDGSIVQLNANSKLYMKKNWVEVSDRQVFLQGEAFFTVTKKPATGAKFTVVTDDLEVEVLGTAFNVHTRGEATEVYLEEGKIKLEYNEEATLMEPGDFVAYSAKKEKITARHRRVKTETPAPNSWKDGVIFFTKEYAFTILKKLEEIYGVEFKVENAAIYSKEFTVAVPMEELKIVIPILEKSMKVDIITLNNNQLIVK